MIAFKPLSSVQWGFLRQGFLITKNRIPTCCITIKEIHVAYIAILHWFEYCETYSYLLSALLKCPNVHNQARICLAIIIPTLWTLTW